MSQYTPAIMRCRKYQKEELSAKAITGDHQEDPASFQEDGHACGGDEEFHHGLTMNLSEKHYPISHNVGQVKNTQDIRT